MSWRRTEEGVLVGSGDDLERLGLGAVALMWSSAACRRIHLGHSTHEPSPARALDTGGLGVHLSDEVLERAKVLLDLVGELARRRLLSLLRAGGREVLPEELWH